MNKIFSFFSGSGFLDLGFETNGFEIDLVNEFSLPFMKAYKYSRDKMNLRKPKYGYFNIDVNDFLNERKQELQNYLNAAKKDETLVGFIGGPPCPDFSVAGKNRGREGDNGQLSLSYVNLIIQMKPDFFLFENVKGLWKTARHRAFYDELKEKLYNADYVMSDRMTNALELAVPQDRDRILLFGVRKELCSQEEIDKFPTNKGLIKIQDVCLPDGPICVKRWIPAKGQNESTAVVETISKEMIWRVANAFCENTPINIDRVLGASYNTRSVLESLIVHTPQFYYCYPGRIKDIAGKTEVKHGHKHILWKPEKPHENGVLTEIKTDIAISEIPMASAVYDTLYIPDTIVEGGIQIEVARRHTQIQIALYLIGLQLGFRTWIAQNDKGIKYNDVPLAEQQGIVKNLTTENLVAPYKNPLCHCGS